METYLYVMILFFGFVFVMAIIQGYAYLLRLQFEEEYKDVYEDVNNKKVLTETEKRENIVADAKRIEKHEPNNWTFSERNLHKAILKGRRSGHLQIMYHGQYWPTGLKIVRPCQ